MLINYQMLKTDMIRAGLMSMSDSVFTVFKKLLFSRHARIIMMIRLTQSSNFFFAGLSRARLSNRHFILIGKNVTIGEGLLLPHPWCVIISGNVRVGENVTLGQYSTLGGNLKKECEVDGENRKTPIIGDNVWIAAGAVVAGPVVVGDNVIVSANGVVTKSVLENSIVINQNEIMDKKVVVLPNGSYQVLE